MNFEIILLRTLSYIGVFVTFSGAILIFVQTFYGGSCRRARRALALMLAFWGLSALSVGLTTNATSLIDLQVLSPKMLIGGGLYTLLATLFSIELAKPGWISWKRIVKLSLPLAVITTIYMGVLTHLNQPIAVLENRSQLISQIGAFNVWYRVVLYLTTCSYLVYMLVNSSRQTIRHHKKSNNNKSRTLSQIPSWLRVYNRGLIFLMIGYLIVLLHDGAWIQIIFRTTLLLFWMHIIYEVAFKKFSQTKTAIKT